MAKVRIRKAGPGETPGYYNKTAMFLKKAQMGMQVEAQEGMDKNLDVYYQYAYGQLVNDVSVDDVFGDLVQNGLPKQVAYKLVMNLMDQLVDEGKVNPQDSPKAKQEEEQPQEEQQEQPAEEPAQEEEDQSMYEEDQDMEDLEEGYLQDRSYMQDGGVSEDDEEYIQDDTTAQSQIMDQYNNVQDTDSDQFDMNELIANTPGIQPGFTGPGLDAYVQDYVPTQWESNNFLQSQSEQSFPENLESQRTGGIIKKKHFVKNVMALLKKQEGGEGEGEEDKKDKGLGKGNPMDTFTGDVQKRKSSFIGAIKSNADKVKAEEMYEKLRQSNDPTLQQMGMQPEQQFQTGGFTGGQDPLFRFLGGGEEMQEDPGYYEADFLPEAKNGLDWKDMQYMKDAAAYYKNKSNQPKSNTTSDTPKTTIPKATVRYVPNYITGPGSFFNAVLPWNPLYRSKKFTAQIGSPYLLGTKTAYKDPLSGLTPVARHVHKRGILGRPKVWTDIYSMPGQMAGAGNKDIIMTGNTIVMPERDKQGKADIITKDDTGTFSNTKGLKFPSRAAVAAGELGMRLNQKRLAKNPELLIPGEPAKKQESAVDQDEVARFQHERKKQNKVWDEASQSWVDVTMPKMDIKKPGSVSPSSEMQERLIKEKIASKNFGRPVGNVTYEERNKRISPSKEELEKLYSRDVMEEADGGFIPPFAFAYGGYLPKANNGITINNPNLPQPGPGNPDLLVSDKPGLIGNAVQGSDSFWAQQQSFNPAAPTSSTVQAYNADPANNMKVQPELQTQEQPKQDQNQYVGVKYGVKKRMRNDPEAGVNVFNAGVRGVTGFLNRRDEKRRERQMYDNLTSDNLYASQATKHRGDWVDLGSQMGQYRFDQMGQDRSGFSSYGKYGGYMQDGGEMDYNEGDEVYMTDDELKDFLKKGGQVEYL